MVRKCSESKLTVIFGICMIFSPRFQILITLGQDAHVNRQSYKDYSKNEILWKTSLNMTWIDGFPLSYGIFNIHYNSVFGLGPDEFNTKLNIFFWITHSHFQVVQGYLGIGQYWINVCLMLWVFVGFQWENWVINLSASSGF